MIVDNIGIVTFLVVLFFGVPILWNAKKNGLYKNLGFTKLIKTFNKSLIIQGIIGLILFILSWIWNSTDSTFDSLIVGTTYTYLVIGLFMYLPALGILNLIKLITHKKLKKENAE